MESLQKDYVAKGLDAYSQFKSMGIEALTDEQGNPTFDPVTNQAIQRQGTAEANDIQKTAKDLSPRTISVALDPLERMVPRWRTQKQS